jgi:hypothetical protein
MAYRVTKIREYYTARKGLEGPFCYANGRVLYYDPREEQYWDPRTDFYVPNEELANLQQDLVEKLRGS